MATVELRMHCPHCDFPAKGRWMEAETGEIVLPGRISAASVACSNPRCFRYRPESFPSSTTIS